MDYRQKKYILMQHWGYFGGVDSTTRQGEAPIIKVSCLRAGT